MNEPTLLLSQAEIEARVEALAAEIAPRIDDETVANVATLAHSMVRPDWLRRLRARTSSRRSSAGTVAGASTDSGSGSGSGSASDSTTM